MDTPNEPQLRFIGQLAWLLLWLFAAFFMLAAGLCALNFIVVGLLALVVDIGEWGPRVDGEFAQTFGQKLAFTGVGVLLAGASAAFFWLNARNRDGIAMLLCVVVVVVFALLCWAAGVHNLSGGFGSIGMGGH